MHEDTPLGLLLGSGSAVVTIGGGDVEHQDSPNGLLLGSNPAIVTVNEPLPYVSVPREPRLLDRCIEFYLVNGLPRNIKPFSIFVPFNIEEINFVKIDEPKGFDSISFKIERDPEFYGFTPVASVDSLDFDCQTARNFVDEIFNREGTDADVKFVMVSDGYVQLVQSLNYNQYRKNVDYSMLNLENSAFDQAFGTKIDTPFEYTLNKPTFLYSKQLPLFDGYERNTTLLLEDFETKPDPNTIDQAYGMFFTPKEGSEILGLLEYPMQMTFVNPENERKYILKPELGGTYRVRFDTAFFAWNNQDYIILNEGSFLDGALRGNVGVNATLSLVIKIKDSITGLDKYSEELDPTEILLKQISSETQGLARAYDVGRDVNVFKFEREFFLTNKDELYVYLIYLPPFIAVGGDVRQSGITAWGEQGDQRARIRMVNTCVNPSRQLLDPLWTAFEDVQVVDNISEPSVRFEGLTIEKSTVTNFTSLGSAIREVSQKILEIDTPENTPFRSLLTESENGELSKFFIGNGFAVRGQVDPENEITKPRASFRQLVEGARFLVNSGYNIEFDTNGDEVIVVERMEYFFQDSLILSFPKEDLEEYEEMAVAERVYNEIEVGYSKFSKGRETEKTNTIEDPHGVLTFSTPIKRNKNKFELKSDMILSAFELEITRRKQFEKSEGSQSNEKDDSEIYGVQIHEEGIFSIELNYKREGVTPLPSWEYRGSNSIVIRGFRSFVTLPFISGDVVEIFIGEVSNGTAIVESTSFGNNNGQLESILSFTTPVNGIIPIVPSNTDIILKGTVSRALPEATQPFDTVNGVDSPESFYNLRWTPNRVIRNWGKEINSGLSYKQNSELIKFQKSEGNTKLETKLKSSEPHNLGDNTRSLLRESSDFPLTSIYNRQFETMAYEVRFKVRRPIDYFNYILACHQGYSPDENNYGFIDIEDEDGNIVRGYIVNCEYSPSSLELDVTLAVSRMFNKFDVEDPDLPTEPEPEVPVDPVDPDPVDPDPVDPDPVDPDPIFPPELVAPNSEFYNVNNLGTELLWDLTFIESNGPLENLYDIQLWFQFFDPLVGFTPVVENYFGGQIYPLVTDNPLDLIPAYYPVPPIGVSSIAEEVKIRNGGTLPPTETNRISLLWRLIRKTDNMPSPFFQNQEFNYKSAFE